MRTSTNLKTENKLHLDYSVIVAKEIIDGMLQEVVQQEQSQTTEQRTKIREQTTKPDAPKPTLKMRQPTLQYVLRNNSAKVQEKNH